MRKRRHMLGGTIYRLRTEKGLSQAELGGLVGVTNKAVSKWETDESNPEIHLLPHIAEALGVTTDELLTDMKTEKETVTEKECKLLFIKGTEINTPEKYEFISEKKTRKGTPYVHINLGKTFDATLEAKARGLIAIGFNAKGILSIGFLSFGLLSFGFIAIGLLAFGVLAAGLVAFGSISMGFVAFGGIALGYVSFGALSIGYYANTGELGRAIGRYVKIWK